VELEFREEKTRDGKDCVILYIRGVAREDDEGGPDDILAELCDIVHTNVRHANRPIFIQNDELRPGELDGIADVLREAWAPPVIGYYENHIGVCTVEKSRQDGWENNARYYMA
jgi:hypothetical protein